MDTARARMAALIEWALAAAVVLACFGAGAVVFREFRAVTAVTPVIAHESSPPIPPGSVPPRVISVSLLLLPGGASLHLGDAASVVKATLGPAAVSGGETVEHTRTGERITRSYEEHGVRFLLVFETSGSSPEPRVTAIYLQ